MKQDSEIGVALAAGHPCYFIGFLPAARCRARRSRTCARAEAAFVERSRRAIPRPKASRCIDRQLPGRLADHDDGRDPARARAARSCWRARRCPIGRACAASNPMRYLGGMLGGTWLTALAGDLGQRHLRRRQSGRQFRIAQSGQHLLGEALQRLFQGRHRSRSASSISRPGGAARCCSMPARCSGSPTTCSSATSSPRARSAPPTACASTCATSSSPIIVFCSWGDNITPPQQALGWITDLYDHERRDRRQRPDHRLHAAPDDRPSRHLRLRQGGDQGARRVRLLHGHDRPDAARPLRGGDHRGRRGHRAIRELIHGKYLFRLEARTLDDIRALGGNNDEDEQRFAAAARVSEINLGLYRTLAQPAVRAVTTEQIGRGDARRCIPAACASAMFSDKNPMMQPVKALAEAVRADAQAGRAGQSAARAWRRSPRPGSRPGWRATGTARDAMTEAMFLGTYGSPLLQAMVGLGAETARTPRRIERDLVREATEARLRAELEQHVRGRRPAGGGAARADLHPPAGRRRRRARLRRAEGDPRHAAGRTRRISRPQLKDTVPRPVPAAAARRGARGRAPFRGCCPTTRATRRARRSTRCGSVLGARGDACRGRHSAAWTRIEALFGAAPAKPPTPRRRPVPDAARDGAATPAREVRAPDRRRAASSRRSRRRSPIPATRSRSKAPSRRRGSA